MDLCTRFPESEKDEKNQTNMPAGYVAFILGDEGLHASSGATSQRLGIAETIRANDSAFALESGETPVAITDERRAPSAGGRVRPIFAERRERRSAWTARCGPASIRRGP